MIKFFRLVLSGALASLIISLGAGSTVFLLMLFIGIPLEHFLSILIWIAVGSFSFLLFKNMIE
jgi:hypothetical protein